MLRSTSVLTRVLVLGFCVITRPAAARAQTAAPRATFEVHEATIADLQRAMTAGRATSVTLVDAYLARIAAYDHAGPALNTMIRLNPRARAEARALDLERRAGRVRGPLHGIPIVLKDNFDTADMPTSGGTLALANHQTRDDAFVVQRLRNAGVVILGKTNMHELAAGITSISSLGGQTVNPYDPRRCPGGSSGGTGAAIAASFAAIGWGSDTCGSIRIPAAYGNLVGLRPTQGLVSRSGVMPLSHTQDIAGPLARTVTDLAIALDATVGPDPADSVTRGAPATPRFVDSLATWSFKGARIGLLGNYLTDADGDVVDSIRAAIRVMQSAGADTMTVNVVGFDSLLAGTSVINFEHKFDLIDYLARTPGAPVKSIADILAGGLEHEALEARYRLAERQGTRDSEAYRLALAKQRVARARIIAVMDSLRVDVLVYPTIRRKPVLAGEPQLGSNCSLSAQTGLPAISFPGGFTTDGLPLGIEVIGRPFSDTRLVALAYAFETLAPRRRAPFSAPPLVNGRAPRPVSVRAVAGAATGQFEFDVVRSALRYTVRIAGAAGRGPQAVVLKRRDADGRSRVVHRLSGPDVRAASGSITLSAVDRSALQRDGLVLSFVSSRGSPVEARVVLPKR